MNAEDVVPPRWWPAWLYPINSELDRWTGEDKWGHLFGAAFVADTWSIAAAVVLILLVEAVEAFRWTNLRLYDRMQILNGRRSWPFLADRASPKDVIVGLLGIGLMLAAHALRGLL